MATMGGGEIYLYARVGSADGGTVLGRLLPRRIDYENAPSVGFKLTWDFVPDRAAPQLNWAALDAFLTTLSTMERVVGMLDVPGRARPVLDPPRDHGVEWLWMLLPDDLQVVERIRGQDRRNPVRFRLRLRGVAAMASAVVGVNGEGTIEIPSSEWDGLLATYGFEQPTLSAQLIEGVAPSHPSWTDAHRRLTAAREHLRRGEGHAAYRACLSEFENLVPKPYDKAGWEARFSHLQAQKAAGTALALAGHASLLNKIGHHRSLDEDAAEEHPAMQLDQWEAEIGVATSELLLALALRLAEDSN